MDKKLVKIFTVNIEKFINNPNDAKEPDLIITKEDMIRRLLQFIEFWREKGASGNSVIFCLKCLRHIIVRA